MKLFRVKLSDLLGRVWIERIEGRDDRDVKDAVYIRYGLRAAVIAVSL